MQREYMLAQYLHEHNLRAFDWARWNCCHFASEWVRRAEGWSPMSGLPQMKSQTTAHRLLGQLGGLREAWTKQLGREPILPTLAQSGDIVLVEAYGTEAVGICAGRTAAVLTLEHGLAHVSMSEAKAAWRLS